MVYAQQTWANKRSGGTPFSADRMNHMESGIKGAHDLIAAGAGGSVHILVAPATGVPSTDTINIQQAITNAFAAGGGIVELGRGTYALNAAISLPTTAVNRRAMQIIGQGPHDTIIRQTAAATHGFVGVNSSFLSFKDFSLIGPIDTVTDPIFGGSRTTENADGFNITKTGGSTATNAIFDCKFENLYLEAWGRDGISIDTPITSHFEMIWAFRNGRHGIHLFGVGESAGTSCVLTTCFPAGNWGAGIRLKQIAYSTLNSCAADANGVGYEIDTCYGIVMNACGSEEPYDFHLLGFQYASAVGYAVRVVNATVTMNSPYAISNIGTSYRIEANGYVVMNNPYESAPGNADSPVNSPTYSIDTVTGSFVIVTNPRVITPTHYAAGTTTEIIGGAVLGGGGGAGSVDVAGTEATMERTAATTGTAIATGQPRLTYFTAKAGGTFSKIGTVVTTASSGAAPTLCKLAMFSVAGNGNLTLIAVTANDVTMFNTANVIVEKATLASYNLVAGQRYAWAVLVVSSGTLPQFSGRSMGGSAGAAAMLGKSPRASGSISGQTDFLSSYTFDLVNDLANTFYGYATT